MYCRVYRLHRASNDQNKRKVFGEDPAIRFQVDSLTQHGQKSNKHRSAVESEMLRRVSVFQKRIDEKNTFQGEILHAAFTALYWLVKGAWR